MWRSPWTRALLFAAVVAYYAASVYVLWSLWLHTGLCDEAERDCGLPWTPRRIAWWIGWVLLGITVSAGFVVAFRPRTGRLSDARVAAAAGALPVIVGMALAVMARDDAD